jgi:1-acyl-sn-glycerol-3-phosphate acyltransferase
VSLPAGFIHRAANRLAALLMKLLFTAIARVQVVGPEYSNSPGGFLLAANHISHFDPFIISAVVRRKIDWMAMAEFFPVPILGLFLRAVDAFPAERDRADLQTIRSAIQRLKAGRIVGIFPEGGIRNGARSLLEGAPLRPGASTLAQLASVPIVPCVIVGSDRLYRRKNWLPVRRTPIWIAFGEPISYDSQAERFIARDRMDNLLATVFRNLYADLKERFQLIQDDLPHSPQDRFKARPQIAPFESADASSRSRVRRLRARTMDSLMCVSMNMLQLRHRLPRQSRKGMEDYIERCKKLTAHEFYATPPDGEIAGKIEDFGQIGTRDQLRRQFRTIRWRSPVATPFPANNTACIDLFPSTRGWKAPTVLMLHALLSATRIGYQRWAAHFNALGWNACFAHLPYHYSRVPHGYWNGELAITADLVRNAEGLRQGVMELRQFIAALRERGCSELGVLGTSYGGWIGALLALVERDFRFVALMAPIVNVEHAIWENPATRAMRRGLYRAKVEPQLIAKHFHLSSPAHNQPLCDPARILFVAGEYDSIARVSDIEAIHQKWHGSGLLRVAQGHFGYRMMRETVGRLQQSGAFSC